MSTGEEKQLTGNAWAGVYSSKTTISNVGSFSHIALVSSDAMFERERERERERESD